MTVLTETRHAAEFVMSEANADRSRDNITIKNGTAAFVAGMVLGKVTGDLDTVTVAFGNIVGTGNGVLTAATPAYGAGVQAGKYKIVFVEPAADLGSFDVFRPNGDLDGRGVVGTAYDGSIKFTIADGSTDFTASSYFIATVTIVDAQEYVPCNPTNTDGSEVAAAIALYGCDASGGAVKISAITRDAEVNGNIISYDASISTAALKATAKRQLRAAGIIVR